MKDGLIRGSGLDRKCEAVIQTLMRRISPQELSARCIGMGGTAIQGNADFSVVFSVLPNVPFSLNIWFADEDFDASGRLMLDANADHYLTIEDAVTIGELILERLEGR